MLRPPLLARGAPLRQALALLAVTATAVAGGEALHSGSVAAAQAVLIASYPLVGAAFVLIGTTAWSRRPANQTGALLCLTGLLILGAALADTGLDPALVGVGVALGETPIAATLHVVLAFPSGRVPDRGDRALVVALYVLTLVRQLPAALPGPDLEPLRTTCSLLGAAVLLVAARGLARRVRQTTRGSGERRVLAVVYGYGMALLLFFPFSARVLQPLLGFDAVTLNAVQVAGLAVLPVVFAAGVLRGGFARTGELHELASRLGSQPQDRVSLRDALAQVLGDPSLEVVFTWSGTGRLIDREGRSASLPDTDERGSVAVTGADGEPAGVTLSYDRALFSDPAPVREAGAVVAVALERERLRAELLAEQEALRASRARVVEVGDVERRALAQDLHDVLQSRLVLAALHAGRLASSTPDAVTRHEVEALRRELDALITELRQVVHSVMPALLIERGLPAAAEDLVDRLPLPTRLEVDGADDLPVPVATTAYFILAEALTNATRHARATRLEVGIRQVDGALHLVVRDDGAGGAHPTGAGLRGIGDRVDALGGRLTVVSEPGEGTCLEAVLPTGAAAVPA